jgi:hypothetical protein
MVHKAIIKKVLYPFETGDIGVLLPDGTRRYFRNKREAIRWVRNRGYDYDRRYR